MTVLIPGRAPGRRWSELLLLTCGIHAGCSGFAPGSDVLPAQEMNGLNPASDERWGCLNSNSRTAEAPVFSGAAPRVVLSLQIVDLSTGQIYPDAQVRACGLADITCENPVTERLQVDVRGWVDVPLFQGFTGFFEITSPQIVPYLFYLTEPVPAQSVTEYPMAAISLASLLPLIQLVGETYEEGTGLLAARAFDCSGNTASGVSLSTRNEGVPWYLVDGLPTARASMTAADGLGGYLNVSPGLALIDVKAPNGSSIAGPQSMVVRPGWMSVVYIRPPARVQAPQ